MTSSNINCYDYLDNMVESMFISEQLSYKFPQELQHIIHSLNKEHEYQLNCQQKLINTLKKEIEQLKQQLTERDKKDERDKRILAHLPDDLVFEYNTTETIVFYNKPDEYFNEFHGLDKANEDNFETLTLNVIKQDKYLWLNKDTTNIKELVEHNFGIASEIAGGVAMPISIAPLLFIAGLIIKNTYGIDTITLTIKKWIEVRLYQMKCYDTDTHINKDHKVSLSRVSKAIRYALQRLSGYPDASIKIYTAFVVPKYHNHNYKKDNLVEYDIDKWFKEANQNTYYLLKL